MSYYLYRIHNLQSTFHKQLKNSAIPKSHLSISTTSRAKNQTYTHMGLLCNYIGAIQLQLEKRGTRYLFTYSL